MDVKDFSEEDGTGIQQGYDVFVSYARADRGIVIALTERLRGAGKRAWIDLEDIPPSAEWMSEIREAIEGTDGYLTMISPDLARSTVCSEELAYATKTGKRIVPVLVRPTDSTILPDALARLNWIDATDGDVEAVTERVIEALNSNLDHVKEHTRLLVKARRWAEHQDPSLLVRGGELAEAEAWMSAAATKEPAPTADHMTFLVASRQAATRRQRGAIAAVTAMLLVAATLGVVALDQRNAAIQQRRLAEDRARVSRSREISAIALTQLDENPERSLLLAIEAARIAPTQQAMDALRRGIARSSIRLTMSIGGDGRVQSLDATPDGQWAASGSSDGIVRIWDLEDGAQVASVDVGPAQHPARVTTVQVTRDGDRVVWVDSSGHVGIINARTGEVVRRFPGGAAALSPNGGAVVAVTQDGVARSYATRNGDSLLTSRWLGAVGRDLAWWASSSGMNVSFADDSNRVLTTAGSSSWVWDLTTGRTIGRAKMAHGVAAAALSPDGSIVAEAFGDQPGGSVWNVKDGSRRFLLPREVGDLWKIAFDHDGRYLAVGGSAGPVHLFDSRTGHEIRVLAQSPEVSELTFSDDGQNVMSASKEGTVLVWSVTDGHLVTRAQEGSPVATEFQLGPRAVFTTAGRRVLTGEAQSLHEWEVEPDITRFPDPAGLPANTGAIWSENFQSLAPDGSAVATVEQRGAVDVWSIADTSLIERIRPGDGPVSLVAFSPQSNRLITSGLDGETVLWSWPAAVAIARFEAGGPASFVRFADNGTFLVYAAPGTLEIRRTDTGSLIDRVDLQDRFSYTTVGVDYSSDGSHLAIGLRDGVAIVPITDDGIGRIHRVKSNDASVTMLDFSSDGAEVLSASVDGTITLWDAANSSIVRRFAGHSGVAYTAFFAPDDHTFVGAMDSGVSIVWDADTGKVVRRFSDQVGRVGWASFSPNGRFIETEADAVRIWDAATGVLLSKVEVPSATSVQFSPGSGSVVITDAQGRTIMYRCTPCVPDGQLLALAETRVTRSLTTEELHSYL